MRLILVRHGESTGNLARRMQGWIDPPLTPRGEEQARRVGTALAGLAPAALYSSPLRRALDTAVAVGRAVGLAPEPDPDLRECYLGEAEGLTWDEFAESYPEWAARLAAIDGGQEVDEIWPSGESVSGFGVQRGKTVTAQAAPPVSEEAYQESARPFWNARRSSARSKTWSSKDLRAILGIAVTNSCFLAPESPS